MIKTLKVYQTHLKPFYIIFFNLCGQTVSFVLLLAGLTSLESLNLDSCKITDEGLANLKGLLHSCYFLFCCILISIWHFQNLAFTIAVHYIVTKYLSLCKFRAVSLCHASFSRPCAFEKLGIVWYRGWEQWASLSIRLELC